MSNETDVMTDLIQKAQELSLKTCENCGKEGKIHDEYWLQVRCEPCKEKEVMNGSS
jgi:hypothetical protein